MARVVVVGGGLGGLACAVRLAKLGYDVDLVEAREELGGSLAGFAADGFTWGVATTLLPAVLRDLFRKSGRPLEREVELTPLPVVREHHFDDGVTLALPGGSRAAQLHALEGLGAGLGRRWLGLVDELNDDWELLRRQLLEHPYAPDSAPEALRRRLAGRRSLAQRLSRLADPRLEALAAWPAVADGHDPRRVPEWMAFWPYVEQRFGAWRIEGGMPAMVAALERRLATRGVRVHRGVRARDLVLRSGHVAAVATSVGELAADLVVCAVDPRALPRLARHTRGTRPLPPRRLTHLGLEGPEPVTAAAAAIWHGDPALTVTPGVAAPPGRVAVTLHDHGSGDAVALLARLGPDLRERVVVRNELGPAEQLRRWGGSPAGLAWRGRRTAARRLGPRTPVPGVYVAGSHGTPGAGVPLTGLSAAQVAQAVEADRPV